MNTQKFTFRTEVKSSDVESVREIVSSTRFFSEEEVNIAAELVEERIKRGTESGYYFIFAEESGKVVGYTCFGPIPATKCSYDLYWIAMHENERGNGLGKKLMKESKKAIKEMGGNRVYIETSGRNQYVSTRNFYMSIGCKEAAVLEDFYSPGDAKYIYLIALS